MHRDAPWCLQIQIDQQHSFLYTNCPIISCVLRRVWESQSSLNVFTHFSPWHNPKVMWKYMHTPTHVAELLLKFHLTHQQTDSIFCSSAKTPYARLFRIFCCASHHWHTDIHRATCPSVGDGVGGKLFFAQQYTKKKHIYQADCLMKAYIYMY